MASVTLKGTPITVSGNFPKIGARVPNFTLTKTDLNDVTLDDFSQEYLILNIFPSLDTEVCGLSVKHFNDACASLPDCGVLCISKDLPFAAKRFCEANNTNIVTTLSAFRSPDFAKDFGVDITDGPLRGLLARAIIVLDQNREVLYTQLVPEITQEPDYNKALRAVADNNDS